MKYVIKNSNGMYVSLSGSEKAFCRKLKHCQVFGSREEAKAECCGNEHVVNIHDVNEAYFNEV